MKTIYILLTRSGTFLSKIVYLITGDMYTHASICFDGDLSSVYSSARKNGETMFPAGPCQESFHRGFYKKNSHIPCALYELQVTEEIYDQAKTEVHRIIKDADRYHFNIIGLVLCQLNIPFQRRYNFFCSQFVAEILHRSQAVQLPKETSVMRPMDYTKLPELNCCYKGLLKDLVKERATLVWQEEETDAVAERSWMQRMGYRVKYYGCHTVAMIASFLANVLEYLTEIADFL